MPALWKALACCLPLRAAAAAGQAGLAAEERLPDAQLDGLEAVEAWAQRRVLAAEQRFSATGLRRHPSASAWSDSVVYLIMVDRFNNGNVSNDHLNVPLEQQREQAAGNLSNMPEWRHGGDIQGIRDRLPYLADLGVNTLWITPLLRHNGRYHGYCTTDPSTTDPGFGSPEEFRALVAEAHQLGMRVVMDVVINHLCDGANGALGYARPASHNACAQGLNERYWAGEPEASVEALRGQLALPSGFFPPFRTQAFFNRCGANTPDDMNAGGAASIFGDFTQGMFDYDTRNRRWQRIFTALLKYWIAFADVDGFRLDAARHVTMDFIAYFATEVRAYARTLGKENFFMIGELTGPPVTAAQALGRMRSDPLDPRMHDEVPKALTDRLAELRSVYLNDGAFPAPGLTSVFNFNISGAATTALQCDRNYNSSDIAAFWSSEGYRALAEEAQVPAGTEPVADLWTLIEIHDWPRFLQGGQPAQNLYAGLAWLLTSPGAPVLYYGVEQGFNGVCPRHLSGGASDSALSIDCAHLGRDSMKRQDMFASGPWRLRSVVPEVDSVAFVGASEPRASGPWQQDPYLPRDHGLYAQAKRLVALRRSCPTLSRGSIVWHRADNTACSPLAFSRLMRGGASGGPDGSAAGHLLVLVNPGGSGGVVLHRLLLNDAAGAKLGESYVNALNPDEVARVVLQDGRLHLAFGSAGLDLEPGGVAVFAREGALAPFDEGLGAALCAAATEAVEAKGRQGFPVPEAGVLGVHAWVWLCLPFACGACLALMAARFLKLGHQGCAPWRCSGASSSSSSCVEDSAQLP